jgi:hypothetical protein
MSLGIRGHSPDDTVDQMLKKLFTDDCASQTTWMGSQSGKKSFAETNLKKLIFGMFSSYL